MNHSAFVMPFTAAIHWVGATHGSLDTRHPKLSGTVLQVGFLPCLSKLFWLLLRRL